MKIGDYIQQLQATCDKTIDKKVIVDTTDRDGKLIAAFLSSNFGQDQILALSNESEKREGNNGRY